MKVKGLIIAIITVLTISSNAQQINAEKSIVNFTAKGMFGKEVKGTFTGMKGEINFDVNDLDNASLDVSLDAASIFTDKKKRDNHLKSEDFLEVNTFTEIRFVSESIKKSDNGFITNGEIKMHGVNQPATINFTFENNTFTGNLQINRFDYKIGEKIKTKMVAELIDVEIICIMN
ncbi:YceI family protein [Marinifilum caeruleilacunae]|nr:YceI family protein [Marinifilum caeruleilacunae]